MRVIAGTARRLLLETPEGTKVRPTSDRIKETLFNILQVDVIGSRFLDLFAGSGGIGIEALSRGALKAVFVDSDRDAIACVQKNLKTTRLGEMARVYHMDYAAALRRLKKQGERFDLVFVDPPYPMEMEEEVLRRLVQEQLMAQQATIVVETPLNRKINPPDGWIIAREKRYKTNVHLFLKRQEDVCI